MSRMPAKGRAYIFLDEVQEVSGWERAINSIRLETNADIYITGSNAHLLSSEISTLLSGRYVEINVLPLSFVEYLDFSERLSASLPTDWRRDDFFDQYLQSGGFPALRALPQDTETVNGFLQGIYNTVIVKDVLARYPVRNIKTFEQLVKFLFQNTGNFVSPAKIAGCISSQGREDSVKSTTISYYLELLEKAYIVHPVSRYDIKGKELLKTQLKYYAADTGLRNMLLGYSNTDVGHLLETVVYLELRRRGFQVFVGKYYDKEVDFVAIKPEDKKYFQVCTTILDEAVRKRELAPLLGIRDNYEKTLLTMDKTFIPGYEGIKLQNIMDFLLENV
jgi:predicted AAA+ superfamily ATPase